MVHQVRAGNHIGQSFGVITSISEAQVSVKELVQDPSGETTDWVERLATLQLQDQADPQKESRNENRRDLGLIAQFLAHASFWPRVSAQQDPPEPGWYRVSAQTTAFESLLVTQQSGNTVVKVGLQQPGQSSVELQRSQPGACRVRFCRHCRIHPAETPKQVNEGELRSINIVQVGDRTRLVLNLKKMGNYQTQIEGNAFLVTLAPTVDWRDCSPEHSALCW